MLSVQAWAACCAVLCRRSLLVRLYHVAARWAIPRHRPSGSSAASAGLGMYRVLLIAAVLATRPSGTDDKPALSSASGIAYRIPSRRIPDRAAAPEHRTTGCRLPASSAPRLRSGRPSAEHEPGAASKTGAKHQPGLHKGSPRCSTPGWPPAPVCPPGRHGGCPPDHQQQRGPAAPKQPRAARQHAPLPPPCGLWCRAVGGGAGRRPGGRHQPCPAPLPAEA
ncbi:hypothetical protein V8C86DRAFT_2531074 [Haematococcus lacustris]